MFRWSVYKMSVVCCRILENGIEMASDSISVMGYTQSKGDNIKTAKLVKIGSIVIGGIGYAEENVLMQLFCKTHQPESPAVDDVVVFLSEFADWKNKRIDDHSIGNSYIMAFKGKAFMTDGYLVQEITKHAAIGAGQDFALATLHLGHSAVESVETACELSIYCELPVVSFFETFEELREKNG